MDKRTIDQLRRRFIFIAFFSLTVAMLFISSLIYLTNNIIEKRNVRMILNYIVENEGELQGSTDQRDGEVIRDRVNSDYNVIRFLGEIFNNAGVGDDSGRYYRASYFAILYDNEGKFLRTRTNHVLLVTDAEAQAYGRQALMSKRKSGRVGVYYYKVGKTDDGGTIVVYLDRTDNLLVSARLLYLVVMIIIVGMSIAGTLTWRVSYMAIQPEIKNAENQKRFLTNASHELKTPLAVIRANTEMQEMLEGQNEWTESTMRQVERLSGLIQNLVMITRSNEHSGEHGDIEICDITKIIDESFDAFQSVILREKKQIKKEIQENVKMRAREGHIRQLCSLLVDNAIKYCDDEGEISVSLFQKGRGIMLVISNTYNEGAKVDYQRFFERFYRQDESHNNDNRSGYGIGLSIAENIVEQYRGVIRADWKEDVIYFKCMLKPLR